MAGQLIMCGNEPIESLILSPTWSMSFSACSGYWPMALWTVIQCIVTVLLYIAIASEFGRARKKANSKGAAGLSRLMIVFVFCALVGYAPEALAYPDAVLATIAYWLRAMLLPIHNIITFQCLLSLKDGGADNIAAQLKLGEDISRAGEKEGLSVDAMNNMTLEQIGTFLIGKGITGE